MTVLVTGAKGCIGAWTLRYLLDHDHDVVAVDLPGNMHRLELILGEDVSRVTLLDGDILDLNALHEIVGTNNITHIVHLAALQVPSCRDNPSLGARVNVVGTVHVFEAARQAGVHHIAYASSIAAYSPEMTLEPNTLYGVWKLANEGTARVYHRDYGVSSIALRPYIVYGPGRDFGMTSTPTTAMLAAAAGHDYHIPFGGRAVYHSAPDTGAMFARAALATDFDDAAVFDAPGNVVEMQDVVAAIHAAAPDVAITFDDSGLPFPAHYETDSFAQVVGDVAVMPLRDGVAMTIDTFRRALADGRMTYSA
ncbi:MAG: NAD(P)-dependent oxidoreductase [Chloroflexi bacterium]|nr:MAG: NAD(P)-dependent oxidoreductase [Chloroflexota bacterium]